jgi:hypothetical protein
MVGAIIFAKVSNSKSSAIISDKDKNITITFDDSATSTSTNDIIESNTEVSEDTSYSEVVVVEEPTVVATEVETETEIATETEVTTETEEELITDSDSETSIELSLNSESIITVVRYYVCGLIDEDGFDELLTPELVEARESKLVGEPYTTLDGLLSLKTADLSDNVVTLTTLDGKSYKFKCTFNESGDRISDIEYLE